MKRKRTGRMRRSYLKQYTQRNPQDVNWGRVGGRPQLTHPDDDLPNTKGLTLENLEYWRKIKEDRDGQLPSSCPPKIATVLRYREITTTGSLQTYYPVRLYDDGLKAVDMFHAGGRYFFVELNRKLNLISQSIKYLNRDAAMQAFRTDGALGQRGIAWIETINCDPMFREGEEET